MSNVKASNTALAELESKLLDAHERHDLTELAQLYGLAGNMKEASEDLDAACFYWTHAYVYALDAGLDEAANLHKKLASHGRLHPPRNEDA